MGGGDADGSVNCLLGFVTCFWWCGFSGCLMLDIVDSFQDVAFRLVVGLRGRRLVY